MGAFLAVLQSKTAFFGEQNLEESLGWRADDVIREGGIATGSRMYDIVDLLELSAPAVAAIECDPHDRAICDLSALQLRKVPFRD